MTNPQDPRPTEYKLSPWVDSRIKERDGKEGCPTCDGYGWLTIQGDAYRCAKCPSPPAPVPAPPIDGTKESFLTAIWEALSPYLGCTTGDCPHGKQVECETAVAVLAKEMAQEYLSGPHPAPLDEGKEKAGGPADGESDWEYRIKDPILLAPTVPASQEGAKPDRPMHMVSRVVESGEDSHLTIHWPGGQLWETVPLHVANEIAHRINAFKAPEPPPERGDLESLDARMRIEIVGLRERVKDLECLGAAYAGVLIRNHDLRKAAEFAIGNINRARTGISKNQGQWPFVDNALKDAIQRLEAEIEKGEPGGSFNKGET